MRTVTATHERADSSVQVRWVPMTTPKQHERELCDHTTGSSLPFGRRALFARFGCFLVGAPCATAAAAPSAAATSMLRSSSRARLRMFWMTFSPRASSSGTASKACLAVQPDVTT